MKFIKRIVFFILIILNAANILKSQDIIYLKEYSDTIYCHIISDNIKNIEYRLTNGTDTSVHVISISEIEGYVLNQNKSKTINNDTVIYSERDFVFLKNVKNTKYLSKHSAGDYVFGSMLIMIGFFTIPAGLIVGSMPWGESGYIYSTKQERVTYKIEGVCIIAVGIGLIAGGISMMSKKKNNKLQNNINEK